MVHIIYYFIPSCERIINNNAVYFQDTLYLKTTKSLRWHCTMRILISAGLCLSKVMTYILNAYLFLILI